MPSSTSRLAEVVALVLILAGAAWLRLGATHFIASDELRWLCRSSNFHRALVNQQWDDTFQVGHPGVITMWLGTLALPRGEIGAWWDRFPDTAGCTDLTKFDDVGQEGLLQTLPPLLFAARRGVQLGTVLCLAILYLLLRRWHRLSAWTALTGLAFVAVDPFLVAHSQVLHVDAMVGLLSLLAIVALAGVAPGGESRGRWRPISAGIFAGLAMLAKASALVILPFAALYVVWQAWRTRNARWAVRTGLLWAAGAVAVVFLLWPAMWVHPLQTVIGVLAKVEEEGGNAHEAGNFFMGRPAEDPGGGFYLVALLQRLPAVLILFLVNGLLQPFRSLLVARAAADDSQPPAPVLPEWWRLAVILLSWAIVFGLILSLGPKKFDRYLLPALVAILLGAGLSLSGWLRAVISWLVQRFAPTRGQPRPYSWREQLAVTAFLLVMLAILVSPLAGFALNADVRRYPLASYQTPWRIERVLLVGWGEGYDLAADYLNGLPGADKMEVTVRGVSNFAPLFKGRTRSADGYRPGTSDFVVFYISQVQRRQNPELLAAYVDNDTVEPAYTVTLNGIDYVWVYRNLTLAPLRDEIIRRAKRSDLIVAGGETAFARDFAGPQPIVRYWGHWLAAEMRESLAKDFPTDWQTAWVVRYPGFDPPVALDELAKVATRGETIPLSDGVVEITRFDRRAME